MRYESDLICDFLLLYSKRTLYPGSSFREAVLMGDPDCHRVSFILQPYRNTFFFLE